MPQPDISAATISRFSGINPRSLPPPRKAKFNRKLWYRKRAQLFKQKGLTCIGTQRKKMGRRPKYDNTTRLCHRDYMRLWRAKLKAIETIWTRRS